MSKVNLDLNISYEKILKVNVFEDSFYGVVRNPKSEFSNHDLSIKVFFHTFFIFPKIHSNPIS